MKKALFWKMSSSWTYSKLMCCRIICLLQILVLQNRRKQNSLQIVVLDEWGVWNVLIISGIPSVSSSTLLFLRTNASLTTSQNLVQSLKDEVTKIRTEKDTLQKELDAKVADIQEKVKTITQVKKIGRRYKTQYEELKAQHDKVGRI